MGAALVLLAGAFASRDARAQGTSASAGTDKATAEVLFEEGKALLAQGKLAEACPKLAESLRLDTGIGTMLYLAECWERSGRTASAWGQFREAQVVAARDKDPREKIARARAEKLEPKLARLAIVVPPASEVKDLVVTKDGTPVARALWGTEAPIDPGKHVVRASAPGRIAWETTIDVAEQGARERVVVPTLGEEPVAIVQPRREPLPLPRTEERAAKEGEGKLPTRRVVALGLAGLGVVGLGLGTYLGLSASSSLDDANARCDERFCDAEGLSLRDDAVTKANLSTVSFAASGVAIAAGAVLWFTTPRRRARGAGWILPTASATPTGGLLGASGAF